jgi:hypothetical protein
MESQGWFLIFLLFLIFIICIIIAAFPRARQRWCEKNQKNVFFEKSRVFATALRSQKDGTVIAALPILTSPTTVDFNQPGTALLGPKSGTESGSYNVQLQWTQEATASAAITNFDGSNTITLLGSQEQATEAIASSKPLGQTFLASLKKGSVLTLVCQASLADSISVPASDSATMQSPTTLASISISEL